VKRFVREPNREFAFFLASDLGMTVGEMQDRISNAEFVEWQVYHARRVQRDEQAMRKARKRS
jgi:hypothetical protein